MKGDKIRKRLNKASDQFQIDYTEKSGDIHTTENFNMWLSLVYMTR